VKPPQQLTPTTTKFIAEQDGPPERDLKDRFVEHFRSEPMVERAYLVQVGHSDGTGIHVTLAIKCFGEENPSLIPKLADIFSNMFGPHEHLDMMFIREDQEKRLRVVCEPFYGVASRLA